MATSPPIRTNFHPSKKHSDVERLVLFLNAANCLVIILSFPFRWICIYPAYINSKKSRQEGRRLAKERCVENPTCAEIRDVLSVTNLRVGVENKEYSRERSREPQYRGRIRVQMRNDDGSFCNPEFGSREAVLLYVSKKIPQLKSRQVKSGTECYQHSQQNHQSNPGGGGGKKGKGKRR
uniref:Signal recognition particle 19 kDa protein n=1 Tax=Glossina austeni TaxID=7395 RepID=A0A1A9VSK4_GLOAU